MKSILFVDDEAIPAAGFAHTLSQLRFRVRIADSVAAALFLIGQVPFHLILTEFNLRPDRCHHPRTGNGLNLVRQLRASQITTPVFVFSLMEGELYETASFIAGADDFVSKKVPISVLLARIRTHIQRQESRTKTSRFKPFAR